MLDKVTDALRESKSAVALFMLLFLSLYVSKPRFLFEDNGHRRSFGLGYNRDREKKTLFDMTVTVVFLAFVVAICVK